MIIRYLNPYIDLKSIPLLCIIFFCVCELHVSGGAAGLSRA